MAETKKLYVSTTFRGQDDLTKTLGRIGSKAKRTFAGIGKAAMSLKGLLAGAAVFAGVRSAIRNLKEEAGILAELRQNALAIAGTTPQQLAEVRATFAQMSSNAGAADKALGQLSLRLEQMRAGTGGLQALFSQQMKLASPEQRAALEAFQQDLYATTSTVGALELIMERMGSDPQKALPLLYSAVGRRNAAEVVKVMKEGGIATWKLNREAARGRLGDEVGKAADAGQKFADASDRVKDAWNSVKWRAVAELMPTVLPQLDRMVEYLSANRERIGEALERLGKSLAKALEWLVLNLEPLTIKLAAFMESLGMGASGTSGSFGEAIERQRSATERLADKWTGAGEKDPNIVQRTIGGLEGIWGGAGAATGAAAGAGTDFLSWWNANKREAAGAQRAQKVEVDVRLGVAPGITASAEVRGAYMRGVNMAPRKAGRPQ